MKKIFSLFVAIVMVMTMATLPAFAATTQVADNENCIEQFKVWEKSPNMNSEQDTGETEDCEGCMYLTEDPYELTYLRVSETLLIRTENHPKQGENTTITLIKINSDGSEEVLTSFEAVEWEYIDGAVYYITESGDLYFVNIITLEEEWLEHEVSHFAWTKDNYLTYYKEDGSVALVPYEVDLKDGQVIEEYFIFDD